MRERVVVIAKDGVLKQSQAVLRMFSDLAFCHSEPQAKNLRDSSLRFAPFRMTRGRAIACR
jgi:hypothetical protein